MVGSPTTATARHERWTRRVGEGPRERRGACAEWHAKARSVGLTLSDLVVGGHKAAAEAVELVAHLVVIGRARSGLADQPGLMQRADTWRTVRLAGVLYQ